MLRYLALWVLVRVLGRLPLRVLYAGSDVAGTLAWYASPRLQRVTLDHMRHVYAGGASERELGRSARSCARSAARYWADLAKAAHQPPERAIDRIDVVEGIEHIFEARDRGCGVIFVSAHLGNPESLMRAIGVLGFDVVVLTEPLSPPRLHDLVHDVRSASGIRFVPADRGGVRLAIEQLRAGGMLGVMADRDVLGTGRPVPFFGERARLPTGAVELALRTRAPLVTGFVRRTEGGRVRVTIDPPLDLERTGDRAADVAAGMRRLVQALEDGIRESPEQWFALHPVWAGLVS